MSDSPYLGAYSLEFGKDLIATIKTVGKEEVKGEGGKSEQLTVIRFAENNIKPFVCNATNSKTITKIYGSPYIEDWIGKSIQFYATTTKLKNEMVEALRIRPFVPEVKQVEKKVFCSDCKEQIKGYGSKSATQIAQHTMKKFGVVLCVDCAASRNKTETQEQTEQEQPVEKQTGDVEAKPE